MDKSINLSNDKNFVSYPYLQSKKVYEAVVGNNRPIDETNNSVVNYTENPFSIYYKTVN